MLLIGIAAVAPWNAAKVAGQQPADLLLMAAVGFAFLSVVADPSATIPRLPRWMLIGVTSIVAIVVLNTVAQATFFELARGGLWLIAALVLPWVTIVGARQHVGTEQMLARAFVTGAVISAAVGISDYLNITGINDSLTGGYFNSGGRESGLTNHPNTLGLSCAMAIPVAVWLADRSRWWLGAALLLLGGAVVSGSRAGQCALVLAIVIMFAGPLRHSPQARRRLASAASALFLLLLFSPRVRQEFEPVLRVLSKNGTDASNTERAAIAKQSWRLGLQSPLFGNGMRQAVVGHQMELQAFATGGIILTAGLVVYFGGAIRAGRRWTNGNGGTFATAITVSHLSWLAAGLVSNALVDRFLYIPSAIIAAGISSSHHLGQGEFRSRRGEAFATQP